MGAAALRQSYLQKGFGAAMLCTSLAVLVYELATFCICAFLGLTTIGRIGVAFVTSVLTILAIPAVYFVLKAIGGGDAWKE